MKLVLSGGGNKEQSKPIDHLFASLLNKKKPLLYIPIAIDTKKHPYSECIKWLKNIFDVFGVKNYVMWTEKDLKNTSPLPKQEQFSGVYIGGGNTFYLLKKLKETSCWKWIQECIKKDMPIYGGSAGAIICGKSIRTSSDKNEVSLQDFSGMDMLKGVSIFCHYTPQKDQRIYALMKKEKLKKAIALTEETGIFITKKECRVIGKMPAYLFTEKEKKELKIGVALSNNSEAYV